MELCSLKNCTGCMACYNACPFEAIKLNTDGLGKIFPEISTERCKECGKCAKACPILNPIAQNGSQKAYAAYTQNEFDHKTCSSGGVATALSRYFIENGNVVFGSAFDEDNQLQVQMATTENELEAFKGSKYVYSFPGSSYKQIKNCLDEGKKCLFIGTPCQIAGLKGYLQGDYENLLTVDLVCHGAPPMSYLNEYRKHLKLSEDAKIAFRGEQGYKFFVCDKNGKEILNRRPEEDIYCFSFTKQLTFRESCFSCKYACPERVSDLTIGDFWGLGPDALNGYKGKISVILVNSDKGWQYFEEVKDRFIFEEREIAEAVNGNTQLQRPSTIPEDRPVFERVYKEKGFVEGVKATNIYRTIIKYRIKNFFLHYPRIIKYKILG